MSTVSNLDSSIAVALCAHTHQSGRLRFDDSRALTAWLVCDDCEETVDFLPRQTSAAATHPAAAQAESSAVRDASQAA